MSEVSGRDVLERIDEGDLTAEAALAKMVDTPEGELTHQLDRLSSVVQSARDAADALDVADPTDVPDAIESLQDEARRLEYKAAHDDVEFIRQHTTHFGETSEEILDELGRDPKAVAEKRADIEYLIYE